MRDGERRMRDGLTRTAGLALGLAVLNAPLTAVHVWPTFWVRPAAAVSLDLAVLVLALAAAAEAGFSPGRRLRLALAALLLVLVLGRYGEALAGGLMGRPVNLYWEARHLPSVAAMIGAVAGSWTAAGVVLLVTGAVAAAAAAIYASLRLVQSGLTVALPRRAAAIVSAAAILVYAAGLPGVAAPVGAVFARQASLVLEGASARAERRAPPALPASDLAALDGRDVYLLFLESYGATVFDNRRHARALAPGFAALAGEIARDGWHAASAYLVSPTFGGASWLAHASLLSGANVSKQGLYEALVAQPPETLVDRFRAAGYRTVLLVPGIKYPWPEGRALGFDRIYDANALDWRGPAFGWWAIPDQYSLEALHRREAAVPGRRPLFAMFASIMSHMPFVPIPPYQPDWPRLLTDAPYDPAELRARLAAEPSLRDVDEAYLRAIGYDLELLGGFLVERAGRAAVVVALGDHQPPAAVTGPGQSWAVPVHVFTRDEALLGRFLAAGFRRGLEPSRPPLGGTGQLAAILLRAFSGGAAAGG